MAVRRDALGAAHPDVVADLQTLEAILQARTRPTIVVRGARGQAPVAVPIPAAASDSALEQLGRGPREIAAEARGLAETFARVGAALAHAARGMHHGLPPQISLLNDSAACHNAYVAIRDEALGRAEALDLAPPEGAVLTLADVATLMDRVGRVEDELELRAAARGRALAVLDRVLSLRHFDPSESGLLGPCHEAADSLRRSLAGSRLSEGVPEDAMRLTDGTHPLAARTRLIQADPTPSDESAHLVSWGSPDGSVAVRVLRPVVVYAPGATTTSPVPTDYVRYLLGQADHGGRFVDRLDTEVGGHGATILTGTTDEPIDGAIGCPDTRTTADKCFGLQPEFALRIAIIATDQGPVLIWLRSNADATADVAAASGRLDSFLRGVHFADRRVETASTATAVDTEYDGTYTWTITKEDALAYGTPGDKTPGSLALYPNTFTATLENGQFTLRETSSMHEESDRYEASPGRLILDPTGSGLTAAVTRDPDGTLHLAAVPPILDAGGVFILTTKPWVPEGLRG